MFDVKQKDSSNNTNYWQLFSPMICFFLSGFFLGIVITGIIFDFGYRKGIFNPELDVFCFRVKDGQAFPANYPSTNQGDAP